MGFSRQEYWSGLPFPPPGNVPDPGIKPMSLVSPALAGRFFTLAQLGKPLTCSLLRSNEDTLVRFRRKKGSLDKQQINFSITMSHAICVLSGNPN